MMYLLPLTKDDLSFLLEIRNHESTRINLENNSIFTLEECKKWFGNLTSPWYIILNNDEKIGYFRTNGIEVGCDIHPSQRRKGYARQAFNIYLQDKEKASLWVFEDNFAKKLYKDLGFKETGEIKIIRDKEYIKMIYEK